MVSLDNDVRAGSARLVLAPYRSLSWRDAKRLFAVLAAVTLTVAIGFTAMGYVLVLPFAGIELLAVSLAFYVSLREAADREVININQSAVVVQRGRGAPSEELTFATSYARVIREPGPVHWHTPSLVIGAGLRRVELGRFLSEGERDIAAVLLRRALRCASQRDGSGSGCLGSVSHSYNDQER